MTREEAFVEINKTQDEYIEQLITLMNNKDYDMMQMLNFTSPTGTGKTNMMAKLINKFPDYYFIVTTLSKGQLHVQIRDNLKKLVNQDNFYVYGSADYKINSKLDAEDIIGRIPQGIKCIWLRDEGHIKTNRWDELLLKACYKVINFSATNLSSDIVCNFTSTMMLRTVNQTNGTPEDAIKKLVEIKEAHKNIKNYNPCAIFRCVSGDKKLYDMIVKLCNKYHLNYKDITEDEFVMKELCEDDCNIDVIINKFKIVEGIDIRRAHVLYMDNKPGNNATTIQVIGRCRRNALLYRDDIDILAPENEKLLQNTRECYVYYNIEKMKVDEDENGELQYAFCNYISCQALKPNSIINVKKGQLANGLYILELLNYSGKFKIDIDPKTGFNVILPKTTFYDTCIEQYDDYVFIIQNYGEQILKVKQSKLIPFLTNNHQIQFSYVTGTFRYDEEECEPYFDCRNFTKLLKQPVNITQETIDYFKECKQKFLDNLILNTLEDFSDSWNRFKIKDCLSIEFHGFNHDKHNIHNSLIKIIKNSDLPKVNKHYFLYVIDKVIQNPPKYNEKILIHTIENDIKVESIINDILEYTKTFSEYDKQDIICRYLNWLYINFPMHLLGYFEKPIFLSIIMTRVNVTKSIPYIMIDATYKEDCYNNITNMYQDDTLSITKEHIDKFFNKCNFSSICSIKHKDEILQNINDVLDKIEQDIVTNHICDIKLNFRHIFNFCNKNEIYLVNNKYYKSYCKNYPHQLPLNDIHSFKPYTKIENDFESALIGVDLMKQIDAEDEKTGETYTKWIESRSVSSKIGNYNKFNTFLSKQYEDELLIAKDQYCKGKNEFSLNKKCNSIIGYCVEYYSKYLIYGENFLGHHLQRAMNESKTKDKNDALIIRACMLKYKEMMARGFGKNATKIIKTISIEQLIKEDYQEFVILVKTLGQRVYKFVKENLYKDIEPIDDIDPNLSIRHIAGLADYITEDTILDVKVRGGIGEGEIRQVLAYHYLSTKRSDLHIKRVIVYDATSGRSVIVPISEKNLR